MEHLDDRCKQKGLETTTAHASPRGIFPAAGACSSGLETNLVVNFAVSQLWNFQGLG